MHFHYTCFLEYSKVIAHFNALRRKLNDDDDLILFFYYSMLTDLLECTSLLAQFFSLQTSLAQAEIILFFQMYQTILFSVIGKKEISLAEIAYENHLFSHEDFSILYYELSNFLFLIGQIKSHVEQGIPMTELYIWPTILIDLKDLNTFEFFTYICEVCELSIFKESMAVVPIKITIIENLTVLPLPFLFSNND